MNEEPSIRITKHAAMRGEERLKLNHGSLLRMVRAALNEGMPMAETKGDLWRHMEAKMIKNHGGNMTCIHAGAVFVIHDYQLITVYLLPKEYHRQVAKWLAKNPASARSSGSLKDPYSGVTTPETGRAALKRVSNALKSPVFGGSQPGGAA